MSNTEWSDAKRARIEAARRPRHIIFNDDTHELALEDANTPEGFLAHRITPLAETQVGAIAYGPKTRPQRKCWYAKQLRGGCTRQVWPDPRPDGTPRPRNALPLAELRAFRQHFQEADSLPQCRVLRRQGRLVCPEAPEEDKHRLQIPIPCPSLVTDWHHASDSGCWQSV